MSDIEISPSQLSKSGGMLGTFGGQLAEGGQKLETAGQNLVTSAQEDKSGFGKVISEVFGQGVKITGTMFKEGGGWMQRAGQRLHGTGENHRANDEEQAGEFNKLLGKDDDLYRQGDSPGKGKPARDEGNRQPWETRDPRLSYQDDGQLKRTPENIRAVAQKYDIQLNKNTRLRPEIGLRGVNGDTPPPRNLNAVICRIGPKGFANEEQLARTIYHENMHVSQINAKGGYATSREELDGWEDDAWAAEKQWWDNHPKNPANQGEQP